MRGSEEGKRGPFTLTVPRAGLSAAPLPAPLIGRGLGRVQESEASEPRERPPRWGRGEPSAAGRPPSEQGPGWAAQGTGTAPRGLALGRACEGAGQVLSGRGPAQAGAGSTSSVTEGGLCPPVPTGSPRLSEERCLLGVPTLGKAGAPRHGAERLTHLAPVSGSSRPPRYASASPDAHVPGRRGSRSRLALASLGSGRWRWGRGPSSPATR